MMNEAGLALLRAIGIDPNERPVRRVELISQPGQADVALVSFSVIDGDEISFPVERWVLQGGDS